MRMRARDVFSPALLPTGLRSRGHLRAALMTAAVAATPAAAQDADAALEAGDRLEDASDAAAQGADDADAVGSDDVQVEESGGAPEIGVPPAEGDAPANAPETYTVQPGDTLWGLSQRFLNNPWYWPKVWSYNPQLDNPNWIRPGTTIRFYPGGPVVAEAPDEEEVVGEEYETVDIPLFEDNNIREQLDRMTGIEAAGGRREFFVPADEIDDAGRILNAPEEKVMLTEYDNAYVKLKKGGAGDTFQIFRPERDLFHPITGAFLGKIVTLRGELQVTTLSQEQSLAQITRAWDPIERGDYIAELQTFHEQQVQPVENTTNVKGYIVDHAPTKLSAMGEQYTVVVDKGRADGLQPGNVFTVVRTGDPYTRQYTGMVDEDIGRVIVVETFENTSKGLVLDSNRELVPGDRIELRTR